MLAKISERTPGPVAHEAVFVFQTRHDIQSLLAEKCDGRSKASTFWCVRSLAKLLELVRCGILELAFDLLVFVVAAIAVAVIPNERLPGRLAQAVGAIPGQGRLARGCGLVV